MLACCWRSGSSSAKAACPGIIGSPVPHLQKGDSASRVVDADDLFIDIGASDEKGAASKAKVGDYATFATRFVALSDDPGLADGPRQGV